MEPCGDLLREKLGVAVGAELRRKVTGLGTETHKHGNNGLRVETFQTNNPVTPSRAVDQNKRKMMAKPTKAVTKGDVQVNPLEIFCWQR